MAFLHTEYETNLKPDHHLRPKTTGGKHGRLKREPRMISINGLCRSTSVSDIQELTMVIVGREVVVVVVKMSTVV